MDNNGGNRTPARRRLTPEQREILLRIRRKKKIKRILKIAVPAAVAVIVIAVVLLLTVGSGGNDTNQTPDITAAPSHEATAAPTPTVAPTPEPASFPFDDAYVSALKGEITGPKIVPDLSMVDPAYLSRWGQADDGYLHILREANTNEKIIAITVDDCFQASNLQQIIQCALDYNAKLTILPIGDNLTNSKVASAIKWAWENGMEIENHTYNHAGLYHYDEERMMQEMWSQNNAVSKVLGVNYKMHFFRPRGGDERRDQRIHACVDQLGYYGIAHWTDSGSNTPIYDLINGLAPGKIYLFHTTDNDLNQLLQFIPAAASLGYRMVTLNEMFGLPENEYYDISTLEQKPPVFQSFQITPIELKKTLYTRAAAVIQKRLVELGWLKVEPDGVFGNSSYLSTMYFQKAHGIEATGIMDVETQKLLFSDQAKSPTPEQIEVMKNHK